MPSSERKKSFSFRCNWGGLLLLGPSINLWAYMGGPGELLYRNGYVMIAQWKNKCISLSVLPVARVRFPTTVEHFKGFFADWSHSANPSLASVAENGSIFPQWHRTTCDIEEEGRSPTTDRWWPKSCQDNIIQVEPCLVLERTLLP